jgi:hypothetical protein
MRSQQLLLVGHAPRLAWGNTDHYRLTFDYEGVKCEFSGLILQ